MSAVRFSFSGCHRAFDFQHLLQELDLAARVEHSPRLGWQVRTDEECLEYAAALRAFFESVERKASTLKARVPA